MGLADRATLQTILGGTPIAGIHALVYSRDGSCERITVSL